MSGSWKKSGADYRICLTRERLNLPFPETKPAENARRTCRRNTGDPVKPTNGYSNNPLPCISAIKAEGGGKAENVYETGKSVCTRRVTGCPGDSARGAAVVNIRNILTFRERKRRCARLIDAPGIIYTQEQRCYQSRNLVKGNQLPDRIACFLSRLILFSIQRDNRKYAF